jgi:C-5 cytosine-specific DNA methylase
MSERPVLLDLFCGAGGCTKGYQRAGFHVVGVDIAPQPNYCGDEFVQADALAFLRHWLVYKEEASLPSNATNLSLKRPDLEVDDFDDFDAIHASPPCQNRTALKARWQDREHPELIAPTRDLLEQTGLPFVIENVEGAKSVLREPIMLCGSAFGLPLRRHRLFELNWEFPIFTNPGCMHGAHGKQFRVYEHGKWRDTAFLPVYGHGGGKEREAGPDAMGIDWMTRAELTQAIPPSYTEFIGSYLLQAVERDQVRAS